MQVAIYVRVSTTRQAENELSIPDQLRQLREWAKSNGHIVVFEYQELGASATDDKRPVFQQMITEALQKPVQFDAIIIHSLSRFFRDGIEFGVYERKLAKNKVKVISITQPTSDDAGGEMMRRIINLFDEHQSKENSKHTSRAMKENARQGYFNGSKPPFGYDAIATEAKASRGRNKKKLEINESEADLVKTIYHLYLNGDQGKSLGVKEIAMYLNKNKLTMRGKLWGMQKIHKVLSDALYSGDYYFNVIDSKTGEKRAPEEWVKTSIPPIITADIFEKVRLKRKSRSPAVTAPRIVNSPTLLTGLLTCGHCGNALTLATGKGGRYRYYKCTNRRNKGNDTCASKNLPMEKVDHIVLSQLAEKVFAPERIQTLVSAFRKQQHNKQEDSHLQKKALQRKLDQQDEKQHRLIEAIENGILELDEITQKRVQQIKNSREALKIEMANLNRLPEINTEQLRASQIEKLSRFLKQKLLNEDKVIAKSYLNLLVDEIKVTDNTAVMKGNIYSLIAAGDLTKEKSGGFGN